MPGFPAGHKRDKIREGGFGLFPIHPLYAGKTLKSSSSYHRESCSKELRALARRGGQIKFFSHSRIDKCFGEKANQLFLMNPFLLIYKGLQPER
jgi:hypothetical protein